MAVRRRERRAHHPEGQLRAAARRPGRRRRGDRGPAAVEGQGSRQYITAGRRARPDDTAPSRSRNRIAEGPDMAVIEMDIHLESAHDLVGPVIRAGHLAEAVIEAVEADNPGRDVLVLDRDDYVRIHTSGECRLTRASLERSLGQPFQLAAL